jgi:hypothetical protein
MTENLLQIVTWKSNRIRDDYVCISDINKSHSLGRGMAQAVSRRLPTADARVRAQVTPCGICGGLSDSGAGFLRVLRFPRQLSFHRLLHIHHHLSSEAGTIGQLVADVSSGLSLTPPQEVAS